LITILCLLPTGRILVMPKGRRRFELGYGPPVVLPGGHNPKAKADPQERYITRILVDNMYEMHPNSIKCTYRFSAEPILSARVSRSESHRTMCRRGMHERPDIVSNFNQSRARFPANQLYQMRDLRHGCQGSITITNPIMEE
jgi:hypothetical protein